MAESNNPKVGNLIIGNVISIPTLISAAVSIVIAVGTFWTLFQTVKDANRQSIEEVKLAYVKAIGDTRDSFDKGTKDNAIAIYNLQVLMAVQQSKLDATIADRKTDLAEQKDLIREVKVNIADVLKSLQGIEISMARIIPVSKR